MKLSKNAFCRIMYGLLATILICSAYSSDGEKAPTIGAGGLPAHFEGIPIELQVQILHHLGAEDLLRVLRTSKILGQAAQQALKDRLEELQSIGPLELTPAHIKYLGGDVKALKRLGIAPYKFKKDVEPKLKQYRDLIRTIKPRNSAQDQVDRDTLIALQKFPNLTTLVLEQSSALRGNDLRFVPKTLTHLSLIRCPEIKGDAFRAIAESCPNVEVLSFDECGGIDSVDMIKVLFEKLSTLNINNTTFLGETPYHNLTIILFPCVALKVLNLRGCSGITNDDVARSLGGVLALIKVGHPGMDVYRLEELVLPNGTKLEGDDLKKFLPKVAESE